MRDKLVQSWYQPSLNLLTAVLLPLSWLFGAITMLRRWMYRAGLLKSCRFTVPVIMVGNITIGGTGKTPLVIELAHLLRAQGYRPGIVSRGAGGKTQRNPLTVSSISSPAEVGDEAILMQRRAMCPVVVCTDRVAAVRDLLAQSDCNMVISDDGLQHYRLARDIEIGVVDGVRQFGNGHLLPAGPLREPLSRLQRADFLVKQEQSSTTPYSMRLEPVCWLSASDASRRLELSAFSGKSAHAVAGIGYPQRFFDMLSSMNIHIHAHPFPDHYFYRSRDLDFKDDLPILMTEKDAVKCAGFADERHWYLQVSAKISDEFKMQLLQKLNKLERNHETAKDCIESVCHSACDIQRDDIRK